MSPSFRGAMWCILGMFFVAPLVAVLFRLPTWPNGVVSGLPEFLSFGLTGIGRVIAEVLLNVFFADVFWGGFVVLGLLGWIAGKVSELSFGSDKPRSQRYAVWFALLVDLVIALSLAFAANILKPYMLLKS